MNSSMWGYMFLVLGLIGIVLINIFGNITIKNEQDYYSLKEVTKAAMLDAVDDYAYLYGVGYDGVTRTTDPESMHCQAGVPGTIRIIKERFVELFILKLSQSINMTNNNYTVTFRDIDECPPKATVVITVDQQFNWIRRILGIDKDQLQEANIVNTITGILESSDPFEVNSTSGI